MKKKSKNTFWWWDQQNKILKKKQKKEVVKNKKKKKRSKSPIINRVHTESIKAPKTFSIESKVARKQVIKFLKDLRELFADKNTQKFIIDFTRTERFIADATLLFYAELQYLVEMKKNRIIVNYRPPKNNKAFEVLRQIGFYKICGRDPKKRNNENYDDVVHWCVATGSVVDNSLCAPALERYEGNYKGKLAEPLINNLFRGLAEAMTNTSHHAYIDDRNDGLNYRPANKNWWMFSQSKDNHLSVVFCDLGIGIPRTLPIKKPNLFKQLVTMNFDNIDSQYIKISVEYKRTRTGKPGRGRGLRDIVDSVTEQNAGIVKIYSNRGLFIKSGTNTTTHDLKESILGTLICWDIPLNDNSYRERNN